MGELLFPFVRWAQDEKTVFLKVELRNVQDPTIKFLENRIEFQAVGEGAKGCNQYYFMLDLFGQLSEKECTYKIGATSVDLVLKKSSSLIPPKKDKSSLEDEEDDDPKTSGWWPRLTAKPEKMTWLKIDFSRWKDPDISSSSDEEKMKQRGKIPPGFDMDAYEKQQAEEMWNQMKFDPKNTRIRSPFDLTKTYLVVYNLMMFAGFFFILVELTVGYMREKTNYFPKTWAIVGGKLFCCQMAQFLEVGHILAGHVKSSLIATLMQITGRAFVLFVILNGEPKMQDKPFIFYLFFVWSLVEIIRYPYYLMSVLKKNLGLLTWLRYTVWIILYPLGFLCEGVIIIRAMPLYEESQKYSFLQLPNSWNMAFDFPSVLKLYLLFLFLPGIALLLAHMRQLRLKKLQKKKQL